MRIINIADNGKLEIELTEEEIAALVEYAINNILKEYIDKGV
jgi:hypothetical protein